MADDGEEEAEAGKTLIYQLSAVSKRKDPADLAAEGQPSSPTPCKNSPPTGSRETAPFPAYLIAKARVGRGQSSWNAACSNTVVTESVSPLGSAPATANTGGKCHGSRRQIRLAPTLQTGRH